MNTSPPASRAVRTARGIAAFGQGMAAEELAAGALTRDGLAILARRMRTPFGEIDLIAASPGLLCFVEVKCRRSLADAAHALSDRQAGRLWSAADHVLLQRPDWSREAIRFDLIAVDPTGALRRIRDILRG